MGRAETALNVMKYVKQHPGKSLSTKTIAKATGASSSGVLAIMHRMVESKIEPVIESKKGKTFVFRYEPQGGGAVAEAPTMPGELTLSFPTTNGHAVSLTLEQARKLYDQLKDLFTSVNPS
jgi:hypothetical protein